MSLLLQLMLTDYAGKKISFEFLSATVRWTQSLTSESQGFSEETWHQMIEVSVSDPWSEYKSHIRKPRLEARRT